MSWPVAAVIMVALVVIGVLGLFHVDTNSVVLILVTVLGGLGYGQLSAIKEQTNGNNAQLLGELQAYRKLHEDMARSASGLPPATVDPAPPAT